MLCIKWLIAVCLLAGSSMSAQGQVPEGAPLATEAQSDELRQAWAAKGWVSAGWWGFNATDATDAVQSAIDSGAATVVIPAMPGPWVVRPVKLRGDLALLLGAGAVVVAKRGEFRAGGDSLFSAVMAENLTIRGYGATLRMWKEDYQKPPYEQAEWRMGIDLQGCNNVAIEVLRIEQTGGDGIYVGCTDARPYCEDVVIRDVVCDGNHRQGISVIGARNLLIDNCAMNNTDGTAPRAGIDFEPNGGREYLTNCVVRRSVFMGNSGAGIQLYLKNMSGGTEAASITFEDCLISGGASAGISVGSYFDDAAPGVFLFNRCTVMGTNSHGIRVSDMSAATSQTIFRDCRLINVGTEGRAGRSVHAPISIGAAKGNPVAAFGGVRFENTVLYETLARPAVVMRGGGEAPMPAGISGELLVHAPAPAAMDMPEGFTVDLLLRMANAAQ